MKRVLGLYTVIGEFPRVTSLRELKEYAERNKVESINRDRKTINVHELARKANLIS